MDEYEIYFMELRVWKPGLHGFSRTLVIAAKANGSWVQTFAPVSGPAGTSYSRIPGLRLRQETHDNPSTREKRLAKKALDLPGSPDWIVIV